MTHHSLAESMSWCKAWDAPEREPVRAAKSDKANPLRLWSLMVAAVAAPLALATSVSSQQPAAAPGERASVAGGQHRIVLARELREVPASALLLDVPPADDGVAGARLAVNDNATTGRFLQQEFTLDVVQSGKAQELVGEIRQRVDAGAAFVVADTSPATVIALADALKGKDALIFNAGSSDDRLRERDCRPNVVHTAPARAMLADALAQYLVWKRWPRWFLVHGTDRRCAFAEAMDAPPSGSRRRSSRSGRSGTRSEAAAPTAAMSRSRSRFRP